MTQSWHGPEGRESPSRCKLPPTRHKTGRVAARPVSFCGQTDLSRDTKMTKSIISEDLTVTGDITGSGLIEVQGIVRGDMQSESIDILPGGQVEGAVKADTAHVRGQLKGSLTADSVDLYAAAKVDADVSAGTMSSEKGARVVGRVDIGGTAGSKKG